MCRKFLCFNLLKSLLAVISLLLLMAKWCTVPPLSTPSRVRGNNCCTTEGNYAEYAALCTVGKGTYKMPWGHFMLYGVYASRRFANLHQTPFDTNLSKYFFHAMGNTKKAKSSEMLHVVACNTQKVHEKYCVDVNPADFFPLHDKYQRSTPNSSPS